MELKIDLFIKMEFQIVFQDCFRGRLQSFILLLHIQNASMGKDTGSVTHKKICWTLGYRLNFAKQWIA